MSSLKTVRISDFSGDIIRAQASLGASGGTVIINQPVSLLAAIIPNSNVSFEGVPGVPITQCTSGENVFQLYLGQSNVKFNDLTMIGGRAAVSGFNCPNVTIFGCSVTGAFYRGLDFGAGATNLKIQENSISAFAPGATDGIFCEDTGAGLDISNNFLDAAVSTHGIAVHTSSGACVAPSVSYNTIRYNGGNFAVEVGKFNTGARIANAVVANNSITIVTLSLGAISLSSADTPAVTGNVIDLQGSVPGIQAIEFADVAYGVIDSKNIILNNGANGGGVILDSSSNCIVNGNRISGFVSLVNSGTFAGNVTLTSNIVQSNVIQIPAGSTRNYIFFIQANVANCNANNNLFIGNTSTTPVGGTTAVHPENDFPGGGATINGTVDVGNAIVVAS